MTSFNLLGRKVILAGIFFLATFLLLNPFRNLQAQCTTLATPVAVTSATDDGLGDTSGTLSYAISVVNASCTGGTINISSVPGNLISLSGSLLAITQSVSILGN